MDKEMGFDLEAAIIDKTMWEVISRDQQEFLSVHVISGLILLISTMFSQVFIKYTGRIECLLI